MEYDDFSLSANFEKMASEYYNVLKKKGFVFLRLENASDSVLQLARKTIKQLEQFENILSSLKRYSTKKITDLKSLTEFQKNNLAKMYEITPEKSSIKSVFPNIDNIISHEAGIIKSYFELLELEDDSTKHITIKNMLTSRLDLLSN